jgi:hypothetical protein
LTVEYELNRETRYEINGRLATRPNWLLLLLDDSRVSLDASILRTSTCTVHRNIIDNPLVTVVRSLAKIRKPKREVNWSQHTNRRYYGTYLGR